MLVHPDKVKDIFLVYVVVYNVLSAQKGAGGNPERELGDGEIPRDLGG